MIQSSLLIVLPFLGHICFGKNGFVTFANAFKFLNDAYGTHSKEDGEQELDFLRQENRSCKDCIANSFEDICNDFNDFSEPKDNAS